MNAGQSPLGVAFTPDGNKVYVTNFRDNNTSVIDAVTNQVIATVHIGINPAEVAVSPDGSTVYVTNRGSDNVSIIDTASNNVTATVNVGRSPICIAFGNFTDSNATGPGTWKIPSINNQTTMTTPSTVNQSINTNSTLKIPAGFNFLILSAMILLYIWKKSTRN